ncbi:MAG: GerW family sporulation protein [Clostridia bacterium]|nr:GerW family sporulation protein [Clostridia bacterium]
MEIIKDQKISSVMQTALENIKDMIDVNTVVGEAVIAGNGNTVIPVSKVSFGFVAGGGDYGKADDPRHPFAGGSGAGVSLQPVGFLVIGPDGDHMLPAQNLLPWEHTIAMLPRLISDVKAIFSKDESNADGEMPMGEKQ